MSANFSSIERFGKQANLGGSGFRKLSYLVIGFFLLLLLFSTFKTVPAGHRAVVFNNITGGLDACGEGLTLLMPLTQRATIYDVRTATYMMSRMVNEGKFRGDDSVQALTNDGQEVAVDVSILYHPDPNKFVFLHREIGPDYESKIVRPSGRSVTRTSVSKYAVIDVYGNKRSEIQNEVQAELKALFDKSYLILDSLLVRNLDFSPEFKKAII